MVLGKSKSLPEYVGRQFSDFCIRFLCVAEPENFNTEKIGIAKKMLIDYLCDLFKSTTLVHDDHEIQTSIPIIDIATEQCPSKDEMDSFITDEDYDPCAEIYEQIYLEDKAIKEEK